MGVSKCLISWEWGVQRRDYTKATEVPRRRSSPPPRPSPHVHMSSAAPTLRAGSTSTSCADLRSRPASHRFTRSTAGLLVKANVPRDVSRDGSRHGALTYDFELNRPEFYRPSLVGIFVETDREIRKCFIFFIMKNFGLFAICTKWVEPKVVGRG